MVQIPVLQLRSLPRRNPLFDWAKSNPAAVQRIGHFVGYERDQRWAALCALDLVNEMMEFPYEYKDHDKVLDIVFENLGRYRRIAWSPMALKNVFSSSIEAPEDASAPRGAAIVAADIIYERWNHTQAQLEHSISDAFFTSADRQELVTDEKRLQLYRNTVIATQHALVNHIAAHRNNVSMSRGAAVLALLSAEDGYPLWNTKLKDINISRPAPNEPYQVRFNYG